MNFSPNYTGSEDVLAQPPKNHEGSLPFLKIQNIQKIYGPTVANNNVDLNVYLGKIIGLVGANGAGKSTLMRVISGVTRPDSGSLEINGASIDLDLYDPKLAANYGIRVVYQEISLCDNLKIYENFYIELSQLFDGVRNWRRKAQEIASAKLDEIFPGHGINVTDDLSAMTITQKQMIEIARAFSDPNLKLLILDEPTSSLPSEQTNQLLTYIKQKAAMGLAFIYISHRIFEIEQISDQIVVMKDGSVDWHGPAESISEKEIIRKMGGLAEKKTGSGVKHLLALEPIQEKNVSVNLKDVTNKKLSAINADMRGGEIIGIAGLEGSGQKSLIDLIFNPKTKHQGEVARNGSVAYVTGNRAEEGIFPLWSNVKNTIITTISNGKIFSTIPAEKSREDVNFWFNVLNIKGNIESPILSLSGGNQQKVLIARSLLANTDVLILDDPTRGVDVDTKEQLYSVFSEVASSGRLVIWYSTDDSEFSLCSRVFVMKDGKIIRTLSKEEAGKQNIIDASFSYNQKKVDAKDRGAYVQKQVKAGKKTRFSLNLTQLIPLISMLAVYIICGLLQPAVFSMFGVELLVSGALPLIFASIAQTFIIGLSHTDLGVGNFMGLTSVITAAILYSNPALGFILLLCSLLLYSSMGLLIYFRQIPPVIVTLGSSFIWTGCAYTIQSIPGGNSPAFLTKLFSFRLLGIPSVVIIAVLGMFAAHLIYRSKYGTILRGFGNHDISMIRSGWSKKKAYWLTYFFSGVFALIGGLAFTGITSSSDAKAMDSYTLLTIASVVIGGGVLSGGYVSHIGSVFGSITLSLVTVLLGFMKVNTDFTAAVQGLLLLLILSLRLLSRREKA